MNRVLRILLVAAPLVAPLAGQAPASACAGPECTVRCVQDLVIKGYCRLG